MFFALAVIGEMGHKEGFAGNNPLGHAAQGRHKTTPSIRAISFKANAVCHIHHGACFGNDRFLWA